MSTFSSSERKLILTLGSIQFCHIVDFMILMPLGPQLMRAFDIGPTQFGLLVSSYTFSAGLSGLLSASLMDRFDRKNALLFLYFGFIIGTLGCSFAQNYHQLLWARIGAGCFGGVLGSMCYAIVGDVIDIPRRGAAIGLLMSSFSVASVAGVPFALWVATLSDWHRPFLLIGIVSILIWIFSFITISPLRSHLQGQRTSQNPLEFFEMIVTNKKTLGGLLLMFLLVFGHFGVIPFLSPSLVANAGLKESQLPLIYLVGGIVSMFSAPWAGRIADRFGALPLLRASALFSILPFLAITNLWPLPLLLILSLVALFFFTMSGRMVPANTLLTTLVPSHQRGRYMGFVFAIQQFSAAGSSFVAGLFVTKGPHGELQNYYLVGIMAALLTLSAVALTFTPLIQTKTSDGA